MNYVLMGVSHKTAPIALREKLALGEAQSRAFLQKLLASQTLREGAVLSTCNRVEVYGVGESPQVAGEAIRQTFISVLGEEIPARHFYQKQDVAAVNHLFAVTASLDSMVLGENQISGQVKQAYQQACDCQAVGTHLHRLFHKAFAVAGRVKTETEIGRGQVSLGSVAVMLTKKIFGTSETPAITVFGMGEMGRTVLTSLKAEHPQAAVTLVNRTGATAEELAAQDLGQARALADLPQILAQTDILITSVSRHAEDFSRAAFERLMERRRHSPLFLIDLGVPRNIASDAGEITNVYLYNVDDLQKIAAQNQQTRAGEARIAQTIVDAEAQVFFAEASERRTASTIAELHKKMEHTRQQELEKTLLRLRHLTESDKQAIDGLTQALVKKILHEPILHLKYDDDIRQAPVLNLISRIFSLKDEENT